MSSTQTLLVLILMVVVFVAGFVIGRMTETPLPFIEKGTSNIQSQSADETNPSGNGDAQDSDTEGSDSSASEGEVEVSAQDLTPGQRKLLESLGINADEVTITAEMVACAEAKLGAARVEEIKNGATPSFIEGTKLVTCYK